jgi:hypothetical protein
MCIGSALSVSKQAAWAGGVQKSTLLHVAHLTRVHGQSLPCWVVFGNANTCGFICLLSVFFPGEVVFIVKLNVMVLRGFVFTLKLVRCKHVYLKFLNYLLFKPTS